MFKKLLIFLVLLVGGLYLYGRSLPREHVASSTITLVARPDTVFAMIRNVGGQAAWWNDVASVRPLSGKPRESWEQDMGSMGKVQLEVTTVNPPSQLVTTILNDDQQDWGGKWIYSIATTAAGTEVTIYEEGWVATPTYRLISKLMGHHKTMDSFLTSLAAHFGEVGNPRHGR